MTTASTASAVPFRENRFLHTVCILFIAVWIVSAIHPEIPEDWLLENLLVFLLVGILLWSYPWLALSQTSYLVLFVFLFLHEAGAHYQYAAVPAGEWVKEWLHLPRNHYDRWVHFLFGLLLAYPQREVLLRKAKLSSGWASGLAVATTLALGALYEILEAFVASVASPEAGDAYLGSQGDPWDSQKDMFMGCTGAIVSMTAVTLFRRNSRRVQS